MGSQFWWIYDILVIVILIATVVSNAKRGFQKNFLIIIGYTISSIVAALTSGIMAETVYTSVMRGSNLEGFEECIRTYDAAQAFYDVINEQEYGATLDLKTVEAYLLPDNDDYEDKLYAYVKNSARYQFSTKTAFSNLLRDEFLESFGGLMKKELPLYAYKSMYADIMEDGTLYQTSVQLICGDDSVHSIAEYLEDTFVREEAIHTAHLFLFLAIFLFCMCIFALVANILQKSVYLNIHAHTDHLAGGFLGLVEAVVFLCLLTVFIRLVVDASDMDTVLFNDVTIQSTRIFRHLYDRIGLII